MIGLSADDVIAIHAVIAESSGGSKGLHDRGMLESAVAQANMTFDGNDLYPSLIEKASAVGYSLIANHPFVDGNKRIGHACIEAILMLNGYELFADLDDAEEIILAVAAGRTDRVELTKWVAEHVTHSEG
ncbi:MAG: type II toxin-antitoxin system death-on-curing family toxin [Planctomycetota bacterium]